MNNVSYSLSFIEGILTFISPCILPMLPIYFMYLAGVSGNNSEIAHNKGRLIANSFGFVLGFTIVFVLLGASATSIGYFLKHNADIFRKVSGIMMIIFGLNFMGILKIGFLNAQKSIGYNIREINVFSAVIFGMVFGFGWTPCTGAFLGSALFMAGNSETVREGILLLVVYSLGLGIPFILTAVVFDKIKGLLKQIQRYNRIINIISGIVLITAGILVFTDYLKYLGTFLNRGIL